MDFLNETHRKRYYSALYKAGIEHVDCERTALFYIMTGNDELYRYLSRIYDFERNQINVEEIQKLGYISTGLSRLMHLGLHLYNDNNKLRGTLVDTICGLDESNRKLAFNAMMIRACG